ncbi:MAG: hypothetical protein NTU81_03525 [Candidatus Nomurabacteria bacterium]|nr:hypothetical protein [Candidatus Nomurabacteria bacterium]
MDFEQFLPKDLYHSYVIEGNPETMGDILLRYLESKGEVESKSPDVLCQVYESFTMKDVSQIKEWNSNNGITKNKKICIIATKFINREAEQTFLKILEEPGINTHYFIIVPDVSVLCDTIISRVHVIKTKEYQNNNIDIKKDVLLFISSSPSDRVNSLITIIKKNKNEENSGQLRFYATSFINELEIVFYEKFKKNRNDENIKFILNELQKSREYLSTPGAAVKMILEHLALVV